MDGHNQPGHVVRLADGRRLCIYGRRIPPFGQRAFCRRTRAGPGAWIPRSCCRDNGAGTDLGYPASAEVSPGEVLSVYYQVDRPGEKVSINATRWILGGSE
ncbi:MAG: hypothetical protein OXC31_07990 [Spirochaetaceae bacterium]|nr:hypothetical protein [Spirochaetaceae bacterium]